jgi:glycosyltransferase involved in cell wall biosynthesis
MRPDHQREGLAFLDSRTEPSTGQSEAEVKSCRSKPVVVHILDSLGIGVIETWLVHVLRNQSNSPVRHEFLLVGERVGAYEAEVKAMGIPIHRLPYKDHRLSWFMKLRRFFRAHDNLAIVHAHGMPHFIATVMAAARSVGVPGRVAHSHQAAFLRREEQTPRRRLLRAFSVAAIRRLATRRIGISSNALEAIAGADREKAPTASVLLYGFDYSRNDGAEERAALLRNQLSIASTDFVIGHVGRFDPVKNHELIVRSFAELIKEVPNAYLVLVGTGETQARVSELCSDLGIARHVRFPGATDDVPAFMAMFDLFVLPSFSEGLGIVCLEAQAAGTRPLVSTGVPHEVAVVPDAVVALPIEAGAQAWAEEMRRLLELPSPDAAAWRREVEASNFGIRRCVDELNGIYEAELNRCAKAV